MRRPARLAFFASVSFLLLLAGAIEAAPRVALVREAAPSAEREAFENQLRSELTAAGFEVVSVVGEANSAEELEAIAARESSVAAIRLDKPAGNVSARLWVTERVTGKTLLRTVRPEAVSPDAPGIIALRAVELLRASLLELNESHPPRGSVPATPAVRAWVAPARTAQPSLPPPAAEPAWAITAGPTLIVSPGGVPASLAPFLGFVWRPSKQWSSELRWDGPFVSTAETAVGSANIDQQFLTWRTRFEPFSFKPVHPYVLAGIGGQHISVHGSAKTPFRGRSSSAYSLLGLLGLGVGIPIVSQVRATVECSVGFAAARPVVHFSDSEPVSTGRPWVLMSAGVEYAW